jgi:hypothetical protein
MFSTGGRHTGNLRDGRVTFEFGEAVLLHEEISFLPHALQLGLFCLLDGVDLAVLLGGGFEDGGEVARPNVFQLAELINALHSFLDRLRL